MFRAIRTSLIKKVYFSFLCIYIFTTLIAGHFLSQIIEEDSTKKLISSLHKQAIVVEKLVQLIPDKPSSALTYQVVCEDLGYRTNDRLTIIGDDGRVICDSSHTFDSLKEMDNHENRPEVRTALSGSVGTSIRFSNTLQMEMLYVSVPWHNSLGEVIGVVRLAKDISEVKDSMGMIRSRIFLTTTMGMLLVIVIGVATARRVNRRISTIAEAAKGISSKKHIKPIDIDGQDELNVLSDTLNKMTKSLYERISEVEEEKTKMSAIVDNMSEGVIALNKNREILLMNPASENIFGVTRDESLGKGLIEVIKNQLIDELAQTVIREKVNEIKEIELSHYDKKILRVHAISTGKNPSGLECILVCFDETSIKKVEQMRRDFVANASHELKTPLTSIKGYVETLLGGAYKDPKTSKQFLKAIDEDASRLSSLIIDLLDLSKIESTKTQLNKKVVQANAAWKDAINSVQSLADARGITLHLPESLSTDMQVICDPESLRRVMVNLLENAIKFNNDNGEVFTGVEIQGSMARFWIRDTGPGIPEDALERVFERFYRVDKARSREVGGTGLGLSIVKHLVESYGGTISCESEIQTGSTFSFLLPSPNKA